MEQQELRRLENQCIQEQPARCVAACPIHVDARSFLGHAARENWDDAWLVLQRTMPLPGILGRICEAPCREKCVRSQTGGPIEIGALERFCVSRNLPRRHILPLPAKDEKIAVIGGGLAGLTAAWDLARKGYRVDIFHAEALSDVPALHKFPDLLSDSIITEEISLLKQLGTNLFREEHINNPDFIKKCPRDYDAVFLSLEVVDPVCWGIDKDAEGNPVIGTLFQTTPLEGVFAGGRDPSPVWQAAEGRWAASSIDRFLQGVSLSAGREKEGPYETRLYTSLEGVAPQGPTPFSSPDKMYTAEEARTEALRCLQCECLECVKVCPYLERFKGYPKKYAREIYNNESIVMGSRQANKLINSCSLCGLCQVVCPENFAMQDLCLQARRSMVQRGKMPPSAHEFALLDMEFSQSERFFTARHEPGRNSSSQLFFPGCQLSATRPFHVEKVYRHLRKGLEGGTGLMLGCCGAPAHWAGQEDLFAQVVHRFRSHWQDLGRPVIVAACSTCTSLLRDNLPEAKTVSLWQILADRAQPGLQYIPKAPLALHDPCTSREDRECQSAVRRILEGAGVSFEELARNREKTECCGFGGLMLNTNPDLAREVVGRRAGQSKADYLAYCAMCRDSLAAVGKRIVHMLDLFFPLSEEDPAALPRIGWSDRQENRARLKERMLKELWGEGFEMMEEHQKIRLIVDPEVQEMLDRRRILLEDVQRVIHHAEKSGDRLLHSESGRYKASFRPYKATFWVEYTPRDEGYEIHNAYTHRMTVAGGGRL